MMSDIFHETISSYFDHQNSFWEQDFTNRQRHSLTMDELQLDMSEDDSAISKLQDGHYSLLHYACSSGDPDVF